MIDAAPPAALIDDQVAEVWGRSRDRHLERVEVLERAIFALMDGRLDETLCELAESEAHTLASVVGSYGLRSGSRIARALEQSFAARHTLERAVAARLADQVLALRQELERPLLTTASSPGEALARVVLLSRGDRAELFVNEGLAAGMEVLVRPIDSTASGLSADAPDAVVLDASDETAEQVTVMLDALAERGSIPLVVVSAADQMPVRLAIARARATGPLQPGLPPAMALERVHRLLAARAQATATILVVDSDPWTGQHASLVLQQAGHRVFTLADPSRYWETLETVGPDAIVQGVSLGEVGGLDLCRALRADPRWRDLPVIFVASAEEAKVVRDAYRAGGDDVLRKPLQRDELLARVENRLQRARLLRRQGDTDFLTGLAGRQKAERDIDRFVRLARRHDHRVTLALFRIDRFDGLAARAGQAAVDAVALTFSQLLVRSFRQEDVISRWGPNEYVVALFDANTANASVRVRDVMLGLRERPLSVGAGPGLTLTCSAGLATFPHDADDARALHAAADAALVGATGAGSDEVLGVASEPGIGASGRVDVLLVDDDASVASLLMHALEQRQYSVRWLRHGAEASEALLGDRPEIRPRVILLEVNLPGLNGLTLLRSLASADALRHTRVVLLSSRTTEAETVQAFQLGAFDYVAKPFSVAVLTERIRRALAQ